MNKKSWTFNRVLNTFLQFILSFETTFEILKIQTQLIVNIDDLEGSFLI